MPNPTPDVTLHRMTDPHPARPADPEAVPAPPQRVFLTGGSLRGALDRLDMMGRRPNIEPVYPNTGANVHDARTNIRACALLVADVSDRCVAMGMHIAYARECGIPVVVLVIGGHHVDLEVAGAATRVIRVDRVCPDLDEALAALLP